MGGGGGVGIDCRSLVWISKPVVLHPQDPEEGMSLSVFTIIVFMPFFVPVAV